MGERSVGGRERVREESERSEGERSVGWKGEGELE